MISTNEKKQDAVQKTADGMGIAFFLSLIANVYDIYRFINAPGEIRQGISVALGTLGTILLWLVYWELRAEKKQALFFWLAGVCLGYLRWIFIDATFDVNVISIVLIVLVIAFTLRIVVWVRKGVLA